MMKLLLAGIVASSFSILGVFLNDFLAKPNNPDEAHGVEGASVKQIATEVTGVPVVVGGKVLGYIVFKVTSTVDLSQAPNPSLDLGPYLLDSAIRSSYEVSQGGIPRVLAGDIEKISDSILAKTNARLNFPAVLAVNVEQFNYITADQVRDTVRPNSGH